MVVRMPEMDGVEATAKLVRGGCRARILMLTTFNLDENVYRAMKAGASGFLLKDASREHLAAAPRSPRSSTSARQLSKATWPASSFNKDWTCVA